MIKNIISNLRSIRTLLNDEMLDELGWGCLKDEATPPGLKKENIVSYSEKINQYEHIVLRSRLFRGLACLEQGDFERAREDFEFLRSLEAFDTTSSDWDFFKGLAEIGIGDFASAIIFIESYEKKKETSFDTSYWLGYASYRDNYLEEAIDNINYVIEEDPGFNEAYLMRAKVHIKKGNWEEAEKDLSKVLALTTENEEARYCLSLVRDIQKIS